MLRPPEPKLYSDNDLHVTAFKRAVFLNGIDLGVIAEDLADRLVTIGLERIPDENRLLDADVADQWKEAHPEVFGALLDLAVKVLRVLPSVSLDNLPRMADFGRVLVAVDQVLGTTGFATFYHQRRDLATDSVNSNPVLIAITDIIHRPVRTTSADLLVTINAHHGDGHPPKGWPKNAHEMNAALVRHAPSLRRLGWTVDKTKELDSRARAVLWDIKPPEQRAPG